MTVGESYWGPVGGFFNEGVGWLTAGGSYAKGLVDPNAPNRYSHGFCRGACMKVESRELRHNGHGERPSLPKYVHLSEMEQTLNLTLRLYS